MSYDIGTKYWNINWITYQITYTFEACVAAFSYDLWHNLVWMFCDYNNNQP